MNKDADNIDVDILTYIKKITQNSTSYDNNTNLLDLGVIDSFQILEIISFIEEHFNITLNLEDISQKNFESISEMSNLIRKQKKELNRF